MSVHLDHLLSDNAKALKKSAIRELLKLTAKPEIISFAGGLPNPKTFPIEDVKRISDEVLDSQGEKILQYSTTEGDHEFREVLCRWLAEEDIEVKQAITSKQGKKVTKKETLRTALKNEKIQEELKKPTSNQEQTYKVLSNLKRDGETYKEGDTLKAKPCAEIQTLIDIGVIK